jgi:ribonuclease J
VEGHLPEERTKAFVDYLKIRGLTINYLHTSGHADAETLHRMVDAIRPKNLVPIHTFDGSSYDKEFKNLKVRQLNDGEEVEI